MQPEFLLSCRPSDSCVDEAAHAQSKSTLRVFTHLSSPVKYATHECINNQFHSPTHMIQLTARFHALGEAASQQTQQTQQDPSWEDCLCSPACRAYSSQSPARPGQARPGPGTRLFPRRRTKARLPTWVIHHAAPVFEPFVNCLHESQNLSKPDQEIMPLGNN